VADIITNVVATLGPAGPGGCHYGGMCKVGPAYAAAGDGLRREASRTGGRCLYLDGERVADVTKNPAFVEPIRRIGRDYDRASRRE